MTETVSHTALVTHTPPFALVGGTTYQALLTGTIADGAQPPELQQQVNGAYVSLNPPVRYLNGQQGGTKITKMLPGGNYRWTVQGPGHIVSTRVTAN